MIYQQQPLYQSFSSPAAVVIAVMLLAGIGRIFTANKIGSLGRALVIRKFLLVESAGNDEVILQIVGRKPGIIGWLLTAMGLGAETSFSMNWQEIAFKNSSLSGEISQVVPLENISSVKYGYQKNVVMLLLAIGSLFGGAMATLSTNNYQGMSYIPIEVGAVIGIIALFLFFGSRKMFLSIETVGGSWSFGFRFKQAVVGGVQVDIQKLSRAVQYISYYATLGRRAKTT